MYNQRPKGLFTGRKRSPAYIIAQWIVLIGSIVGWRCLPRADKSFFVNLSEYFRVTAQIVGVWPPSREVKWGQETVHVPRPPNSSVAEVQGWIGREEFFEKFHGKEPVIFRGAATKVNGWHLECLASKGSLISALEQELAGKELKVFVDEHNASSAEWMLFSEYEQLATRARTGGAKLPYARSFPLSGFESCKDLVPLDMLESYHGRTAVTRDTQAKQHYDRTFAHISLNKGTNTRMHANTVDTFHTQVYGRKRWLFADPKFAAKLQTYGDHFNLEYVAGYDVHFESLPFIVHLSEAILHPGDVLYFPSMTFRATYNLDEITMGISETAFDPLLSLQRHWLLTLGTMLNPRVFASVWSHWRETGSFSGYELYQQRHERQQRSEL